MDRLPKMPSELPHKGIEDGKVSKLVGPAQSEQQVVVSGRASSVSKASSSTLTYFVVLE